MRLNARRERIHVSRALLSGASLHVVQQASVALDVLLRAHLAADLIGTFIGAGAVFVASGVFGNLGSAGGHFAIAVFLGAVGHNGVVGNATVVREAGAHGVELGQGIRAIGLHTSILARLIGLHAATQAVPEARAFASGDRALGFYGFVFYALVGCSGFVAFETRQAIVVDQALVFRLVVNDRIRHRIRFGGVRVGVPIVVGRIVIVGGVPVELDAFSTGGRSTLTIGFGIAAAVAAQHKRDSQDTGYADRMLQHHC